MKTAAISTYFLFVVALTSCQQDKTEIENLKKEVFAVHDEIMPKMDDIMALREAITDDITKTDSLLELKPDAGLQKRKEDGISIGEALDDADRAMMDWMHEFNGDSLEKIDRQKAIDYLNTEKQKITTVKDKMIESINKAQKFTGSNP